MSCAVEDVVAAEEAQAGVVSREKSVIEPRAPGAVVTTVAAEGFPHYYGGLHARKAFAPPPPPLCWSLQ